MRFLSLLIWLAREVQTNSGISPRGKWGAWGAWSRCSTTCGSEGSQTRSRSCRGQLFLFDCDEGGIFGVQDRETQTRTCNRPECCKQSESYWDNWSSWTSCPTTCGPAKQYSTRLCKNPNPLCQTTACPGDNRKERSCSNPDPVDGAWEVWNPWSGCSVSCGSGRKTRARTCSFPSACHVRPCQGNAQEETSCNLTCCNPVDGSWGAWTSWSNCSVSCGSGKKFRNHTCVYPSDCHGRSCEGPVQEENSCAADLPCPTSSPSSAVVGISVGLPILLLLTVAIVFVLWRKKRRGNLQQPVKVEDNALYGTYSVAGGQDDYSTVEDTNDYYF